MNAAGGNVFLLLQTIIHQTSSIDTLSSQKKLDVAIALCAVQMDMHCCVVHITSAQPMRLHFPSLYTPPCAYSNAYLRHQSSPFLPTGTTCRKILGRVCTKERHKWLLSRSKFIYDDHSQTLKYSSGAPCWASINASTDTSRISQAIPKFLNSPIVATPRCQFRLVHSELLSFP